MNPIGRLFTAPRGANRGGPAIGPLIGALLAAGAAGCVTPRSPPALTPHLKALADDLRAGGQARLEAGMDGATLALARRIGPGRRRDLWGRTEGWAVLDLATAPTLGFGALTIQQAQRINAFLPSVGQASPAAPFFLQATAAERERAILCLTQAIYYEAALEPGPGQEAVAQTVLNRVRHPAFPKSICGVVYQGASLPTGCQFSFTCDGSRDRWPAVAVLWRRARAVAEQAVNGFVMAAVGTATSYHADYVFPRWGPTLVKIRQIGAHIFYRFPGPAGGAASFHRPYLGGELRVSMAGPSAAAILAARATGQAGPAPVETYTYLDPTAPGGVRTRVAGEVVFGRRVPTRDEIARINAVLASMAQPAPPAPPAPPAFSDNLPIEK